MVKSIITAAFIAILGGCTAHVSLLALDKETSNQQRFTEDYDAQMKEMEAKSVYY